ncbi:calcium-dependent protein kinase 1-like [Hippocampus comes]|uniref:calcium-dependent protein kinase 1-like n=1 Tax=Hippocampus comes TaxID=109280 RepID=UPI00094E5A3D|nr:PREDICTED: calcium-dependent protein kinase 1-like [Hippocampus comes]
MDDDRLQLFEARTSDDHIENREITPFAKDSVGSTLKRKASSNGTQATQRCCDMIPHTSQPQEVAGDSVPVTETTWKVDTKPQSLPKKQRWQRFHMSANAEPARGTRRRSNRKILTSKQRGEQPDGTGEGIPTKTPTRKSTTRSGTLPNQSDGSKKAKEMRGMFNSEPDSGKKKLSSKRLKTGKRTKRKSTKETETHTMKRRRKPTQGTVKAAQTKGTRRKSSKKTETPTKKLRAKRIGESSAPCKRKRRKSSIKPETLPQKQKGNHPDGSKKAVPLTRIKRKSNTELGALGKKPRKPSEGRVNTTSPKSTEQKCSTKPETLMKKTESTTLSKEDVPVQRTKKRSGKTRHTLTKKWRGQTSEGSAKTVEGKERHRQCNSKLETLSQKVSEIPTELSVVFFGETKKEASTERMTGMKRSSENPPRFKGSSTSQQAAINRALFAEKYQQVNKLGEGGFGSVYAGYRKSDCFPVAIKYIPKEVKSVPLNINGLKKDIPIEALLMLQASIKKNSDGKSAVVSLLNKYDLEHEIVLVMERPVPSVDLFTYITRCRIGALPECEAKNIMKQLVVAAINMHAVDVFHRDLKQENILLEATSGVPRVRIIDFGCSCFASNEPYRDYNGTLCYAPPEYVLRRTYSAGPTTVWHLGALLFELMAGTKRFDTVMFLSQMLRLNRVLSEECEDFLWKCLNLDPEKRATLEQMQQHPWLV